MMATGTLSGRYEIGDRLGSGGMSSVHMATDLTLERTVAARGKRFASGPRRENAADGFALSKRATAAAASACGSSGARRAASSYSRRADSCLPSR